MYTQIITLFTLIPRALFIPVGGGGGWMDGYFGSLSALLVESIRFLCLAILREGGKGAQDKRV